MAVFNDVQGAQGHWYPLATDASIRALALLAIGAGGGVIHLPAGQITLTAPLPMGNNVQYIGLRPSVTKADAVIDQRPTIIGGTRLKGDGTFSAFQYNDAVVTATVGAWNGLTGIVIEGMSLEGFKRGISIGNYNNCGLAYSTVKDIIIDGCATDWAMWFCNFQHCEISNIMTQRSLHGQYYACLVPFSRCAFGNSTITEIYHYKPQASEVPSTSPYFGRGIVLSAGAYDGSVAKLNEMVLVRPQVSALYLTQLSVTATLTSGSASIAVPDSTIFCVGMPVRVSSTLGGFTVNQSFFVISIVDATHITIGGNPLAGGQSASASGTVTLTSYGMSDFEVTAENANGDVQNFRMICADVEGLPEIGILLFKAVQGIIDIADLPSSGATHLVLRSSAVTVNVNDSKAGGPTYDADGGSNLSRINGARGVGYGYSLPGAGLDYGPNPNFPIPFSQMLASVSWLGGAALQGGGLPARSVGDWQGRGGGLFNYAATAIAQKVVAFDTSQTLNFREYIGCVVFNGATGQTFTLPTIISETNPSGSHIGAEYDIVNESANALTIATDGTQLFNLVAALTSLSLPSKTVTRIKAARNASGTSFWIAEASQALRVS